MKSILSVCFFVTVVSGGLVSHDVDHGEHSKATSYQSIKFEHFHAVPTYVKKEDAHLLKHPVSAGQTGAKLEVHHGGKHDHGYAIADLHSNVHHGHGHGGDEGYGHGFETHSFAAQGLEGQGYHGQEDGSQQEEAHGIDYHQLQAALASQGHQGEESDHSEQYQTHGYQQNAGLGLGHYH